MFKSLITCIFFMNITFRSMISIQKINKNTQNKSSRQTRIKNNYREKEENNQCFPSYIWNCSHNITITENNEDKHACLHNLEAHIRSKEGDAMPCNNIFAYEVTSSPKDMNHSGNERLICHHKSYTSNTTRKLNYHI